MDNLAKDIAMGNGETLETLAELMDVSESDRAVLYSNLKKNFATIYDSDTVSNKEVVRSILEISKS